MVLTEEQKARMEENRRKAMSKRSEKSVESKIPPVVSSRLVPTAPTATPRPKPLPSFSASFPPSSSSSRKKICGHCRLVSVDRFEVKIGFHEGVVSALKSLKTASYSPKERVWSAGVEEHDELMRRVAGMRPDVMLEPLPRWIVREFLKKKNVASKPIDNAEVRSRVGHDLWDSLMPFQREGVSFALEKCSGRVYLADDMGLGKTVQALAIASAYRDTGWPFLVVCPSSMRFAWKDAAVRWLRGVQDDDVTVITSGKDYLCNGKVLVISYDLLVKKKEEVLDKKYKLAILDEAHFIKDHKTARCKSAEAVAKKADRLVLLSGTPALSRPIELYSQISLVAPKMFAYAKEFGMRYCDGKKNAFGFDFSGSSNMEELKLLLENTCLIRRLKSDVLSQLPSKQRQMVILDPTAVKTKSKEMEAKSSSYGKASNSSMDKKALLLEWFNLTGQAKAKAVTEYLKDVLEAHQKFLCFAHHKPMMDCISALLDSRGVRYMRIDGNTSAEARNRHVEQFQSDDQTKVALLSITAANAGLTLTAAKLVVFAELFWNPGILTQAEDRAHRIGQSDSIDVRYLVARGTADDVLWPLLQSKLDVLNKAGLSKDNFMDSESTCARARRDSDSPNASRKITDYFSTSNILDDVDLEDWDNDSFCKDDDEGSGEESPPKRIRSE